MTRKINFLVFAAFIISIFISCSSDENDPTYNKAKLDSMSSQKIIGVLLSKNESDLDQLARIFACPPNSLKRILSGKTHANDQALDKFKNIFTKILVTKTVTFDELDPFKQSWAHKVIRALTPDDKSTYWFVFIILLCIKSIIPTDIYIYAILFIILLISVARIFIFTLNEPTINESFKNSNDPNWEILKKY